MVKFKKLSHDKILNRKGDIMAILVLIGIIIGSFALHPILGIGVFIWILYSLYKMGEDMDNDY